MVLSATRTSLARETVSPWLDPLRCLRASRSRRLGSQLILDHLGLQRPSVAAHNNDGIELVGHQHHVLDSRFVFSTAILPYIQFGGNGIDFLVVRRIVKSNATDQCILSGHWKNVQFRRAW